ncbi:MAG TPA: PadR family transcriptional regulator [Acidimicrobiales bacterium]|nr:PadR family transcriptional regulator [Acidimicrobiales bacterium]
MGRPERHERHDQGDRAPLGHHDLPAASGGPDLDDDWPLGRRGRRWPNPGPGRRGGRRGPGGPGQWWGPPRLGGGRRPRGDVRLSILALLAESPMHGYQVIQEITERSGGRWSPSPGSVYPTLQALEDEGLVRATESEGKRVYELTEAGRQHVEALGDRAQAPWNVGDVTGARDLAEQMAQVANAFHQVIRTGSPAQQAKAKAILSDARRGLYQILADGDPDA